jgi:hypothetical protein
MAGLGAGPLGWVDGMASEMGRMRVMKVMPNFMIVGAAKAGTSSLWAYLNQHPQVFLARNKEPNYFALVGRELPEPGAGEPERLQELLYSYTITDFGEYASLFAGGKGAKAVGEASVRYLYTPGTAGRLHAVVPDARLVVMLRDPVKRLYSHYCMNRQYGLEPLTVMEAVEREGERKDAGWGYDWHYVSVGRYARQLEEYLAVFPEERIGVFLYEDFARDPVRVVQEVCRFLGVDHGFVPDVSLRMKAAYRPRIQRLDTWVNPPGREGIKRKEKRLAFLPAGLRRRVFGGVNFLNRAAVARLREDEHRQLRELFADDIAQTHALIGRRTGW